MNEVIIVDHPGDRFNDLATTAIEIVKLPTVSYALFAFNGCRIFIKKDSTIETATHDYSAKLKNQTPPVSGDKKE